MCLTPKEEDKLKECLEIAKKIEFETQNSLLLKTADKTSYYLTNCLWLRLSLLTLLTKLSQECPEVLLAFMSELNTDFKMFGYEIRVEELPADVVKH